MGLFCFWLLQSGKSVKIAPNPLKSAPNPLKSAKIAVI
jgi:hypothetical protein